MVNKHTLPWLTLGVFLAPSLAFAAPQLPFQGTLFETFYEAAKHQVDMGELPQPESVKFIVREINDALDGQFTITENDVKLAVQGQTTALCSPPNRGLDDATSCRAFERKILELVEQEREVQILADDLMGLANGSELAVADEAHRPLAVAPAALMFTALWAGTGSTSLTWPDDDAVKNALNQLKGAINGDMEHIDQIVMRFHFGVLRSKREDEAGGTSGLEDYGDGVRQALLALTDALGTDDTRASAEELSEYATPSLDIPNVALWAREDDIGLNFIYPTHLPRFDIKPASLDYPWHYASGSSLNVGKTLAYPFRYRGYLPLVPPGTRSPLCARISGRNGYLCRPLTSDQDETCDSSSSSDDGDSDGKIVIRTCKEQTVTIPQGPEVCSGATFTSLFKLEHPVAGSGAYGPTRVCVPRTETTFNSTIISNACYVGWCVKESFSGHTLLGGRNPIVPFESTQPYLSCMREDPHLGIHTELPPVSASVIPQYLGADLVRAFEHAYCGLTGQVPPYAGVTGFCDYTAYKRLALPLQTTYATLVQSFLESGAVGEAQSMTLTAAAISGQRQALDQSLTIYGNVARGMAQTVQAVADLFAELKKAPLTTVACPWNGELDEKYCGTQSSSAASP